MVRKIGNLLIIINLFFSLPIWCAEPISVHCTVLDEAGNVTKKTGVMIPVILEIVVKNSTTAADAITIDGLENFQTEQLGTTQQMNSVNGVTTRKTTYRYMIRTQQEGYYAIGPVRVTLGGVLYQSEKVQLMVAQGYAPQSQHVEFEVTVGQNSVFVGQKISYAIRFYANKNYELIGIDPVELEKFKVGPMQGPVQGTQDRNGKLHAYLEWQTFLVPREPGNFFLPPYKAYYKELGRNGFYANFFAGLIGVPDRDKKFVYSNGVNIRVEPLPPYNGTVHGLGEFTSFGAAVSSHEAEEGEGVVVTLTLEGHGNLEDITHPQLQLPPEFVYYDSQSTITHGKKTFEYIVQAKQSGKWLIPAQKFTFFDVRDKKYKTLKTKPFALAMRPSYKVAAPETTAPEVCQEPKDAQEALLPLNESYGGTVCRAGLPAFILVLGFVFPLVLVMAFFLWYIVFLFRKRDTEPSRKKRAYARAKKHIKLALKTYDTPQLYDIFVTYVATRYKLEPAAVSADTVKQKFVRFSQTTISGWDAFFAKITEQAYTPSTLTLQEKEELFKNAAMWLALFEKSE